MQYYYQQQQTTPASAQPATNPNPYSAVDMIHQGVMSTGGIAYGPTYTPEPPAASAPTYSVAPPAGIWGQQAAIQLEQQQSAAAATAATIQTIAPTIPTGPLKPVAPPCTIPPNQIETLAQRLNSAFRGVRPNVNEIAEILGHINNAEAVALAKSYRDLYHKDLRDVFAKKLSGQFKRLCIRLVQSHDDDIIETIDCALGKKPDPIPFLEILCTSTSDEIADIIEQYKQANPNSLTRRSKHFSSVADLAQERYKRFDPTIRELVRSLIADKRETKPFDPSQVSTDAAKLARSMRGLTIAFRDIVEIMGTRSYEQILRIAAEFARSTGRSLEQAFRRYFRVPIVYGLEYILDCAYAGPVRAYARMIRNAVKGAGTNNDMLTRIIVRRYDIDMPEIKETYSDLFTGRDLVKDVSSDTSFGYRKLLLYLLDYRK